MKRLTRENFDSALAIVIADCRSRLASARKHGDSALLRDLEVACRALEQIEKEVEGTLPVRPKGQRSGAFMRYVIDEGERIVLEPALRDAIASIEDMYARL